MEGRIQWKYIHNIENIIGGKEDFYHFFFFFFFLPFLAPSHSKPRASKQSATV
jgi:hypothetical protein